MFGGFLFVFITEKLPCINCSATFFVLTFFLFYMTTKMNNVVKKNCRICCIKHQTSAK